MIKNLITRQMMVVLLATAFVGSACSTSKTAQSTPSNGNSTASKEKDAFKSVKEVTKNSIKKEGLFTIYQDTTNGSAYLLISEEQFNKEYIWFGHVMNGVLDAGYFKGAYRPSKIFSIQKYFDKIEFVLENTDYYYDPENALSRSAGSNINRPVIHSQKIAGISEDKKSFLVKADDIFLAEVFQQIKPSPSPNSSPNSFKLGSLSKDKNKYNEIRNYPENMDIVVEYVFENPYPTNGGSNAVTDARSVTVTMQHSLIEVPQNDYKPRFDDQRVGYFTTQTTDMTTPVATPYRDFIHRWHLVKKDPSAALSEPVEPIVWWIENTTPVELRETIADAVLAWNEAYEKAGFKNAVQVKVQPDDADWDAGDIRYNVLRWTSSPRPPFGGYGPSFVNPRTGQILGADVMLEYVFLTNRFNLDKLYGTSASEMETAEAFHAGFCSLGNHMHMSNLFGKVALGAMGAADADMAELVKESVYYLVLHEVGHTMGLNHNMKSSQLHLPKDAHNKALTSKVGLTGSVMEYPAVNIASDKSKQGQFYTTKPGPYDLWAIEFGYSPALEDAAKEKARLENILKRSNEPALAFGNDADDMRSPGGGIDPRVMIGDMSGDAIAYGIDRIDLVNKTYPKLLERYKKDGNSYQEMVIAYNMLNNEKSTQLGVISRYVGGVYVDRSLIGQTDGSKPYEPVSYEDQKRAMKALSEHAFAPDAFKIHHELLNFLQIQRRGFNFYGKNEDPKIHDQVMRTQMNVLNHLTHKNVLKRMTDSKLYGNKYSLDEFMTDLTNNIFAQDLRTDVNSFRQNLQTEYVERLIAMLDDKKGYDNIAQAMALHELNRINRMVKGNNSGNTASKAHRGFVSFKIESALEQMKKG